MRRAFWMIIYPFAVLANRVFGASYKWVNVGHGAWHRDRFDALWHCRWYGTPIPALPSLVNLCGILYSASAHEGLVTFRPEWVHQLPTWRICFRRDDIAGHVIWYVELGQELAAPHVIAAYEWVEAVFGGSFEFRSAAPGRGA
jgi:hypothetical protein